MEESRPDVLSLLTSGASLRDATVALAEDTAYREILLKRLQERTGTASSIPTLSLRRTKKLSPAAEAGDSPEAELSRSVKLLARTNLIRRKAGDLINEANLLNACQWLVHFSVNGPDTSVSRTGALALSTTATSSSSPSSDFQEEGAPSLDTLKIDFDGYTAAREAAGPKFASLMTASIFLKFPRDSSDCISLKTLVRYLHTRMQRSAVWRRLLAYDSEGDGYLGEHDLENYIFESLPELPDLASLQENFYPFYVFTSVRKFFFFLDPHRTGRIAIGDLVASKVASEWLQLFPSWHPDLGGTGRASSAGAGDGTEADGRLSEGTGSPSSSTSSSSSPTQLALLPAVPCPEGLSFHCDSLARQLLASARSSPWQGESMVPASNWFSAANAVRVYSSYLELDTDQNGLLSQRELAAAANGTLTPAFIARVFQEAHTYSGELDYKAFLDFTLASEYRASLPSLRFFFKLLDVQKKGFLDLADLRYFFRDVAKGMVAAGQETVDVDNVTDEIFDMVAPGRRVAMAALSVSRAAAAAAAAATGGAGGAASAAVAQKLAAEAAARISLEDLQRCKVGHVVLQILTDVAGFWQYDNREMLMQQQASTGGGGGAGSE